MSCEQDFSAENLANLETVTDYLRFAWSAFNNAELYYGHGTDNSWDESVSLVLGILRLPWNADKNLLQARLTANEKLRLAEALKKRVIDRVPVPYITGEGWFMGLAFEVNPNVLVPRSPIAELLEAQLEPWFDQSPARILDLCCGSACIGVAAALVFEEAEVVASDISATALEVASNNIARHHVQHQVSLVQSDLLQGIEGTFDVILANPPYVDARDMNELPAEFHHEPRLGLAAGEDGLDATRLILKYSMACLRPGGILICEVGNSQQALQDLYPEVDFLWPEFARGGSGVFVLTHEQFQAYQHIFNVTAGSGAQKDMAG